MFRHTSENSKLSATLKSIVDKNDPQKQFNTRLEQIQSELSNCSDITSQDIKINDQLQMTVIYISSIVNTKDLQQYIITPLLECELQTSVSEFQEAVQNGSFFVRNAEVSSRVDQTVNAILSGSVCIYQHVQEQMYTFPMKDYAKRSIPEAQNEMVLIGPQEAFIEDLDTNLALLRHKLKHKDFKIETYTLGEYTKTASCLVYIDGLCKPELLKLVQEKMNQIEMDGVLGVSYIAELIEKQPFSPFPQVQYTERPDTLTASMLEGRIGLIVDGSPYCLILPVTFFTLMQASEDYFQRFLPAIWIRWIRYLFLIISFLLPSFYIAITTFHPEMIPTDLLITIAAARERIPFPALIEGLMMELTFEALREAGIRIPKPIGQTISIIGAIVIGQAAVQAGIVSAPMVIVVSITGIASFIIPHFELGLSFRLLRFPVMILGGTLGLFGIIIAVFLIGWHLVTLESFGVPYMHPLAPLVWSDWKDVFIRASWDQMNRRPEAYSANEKKRQGSKKP